MDKQKRFKKQELKSEDYKGMEQGAKALKGGLGLLGSLVLIVKNKDNLKTLVRVPLNLQAKSLRCKGVLYRG